MKGYIKTILCLFLLSYPLCGQNEYYDAKSLRSYIDPTTGQFDVNNREQVCSILESYLNKKPGSLTISTILHYYYDDIPQNKFYNPFIAKYIDVGGLAAADTAPGRVSELLTNVGNLNVTSFADGLAKFLVERSKQELNTAFFRHFKEYIARYPELGIIFPTTSEFLNNIYSYQYSAMMPALKEAFHRDFNMVVSNLIKLRDLTANDCEETNTACRGRLTKLHDFLNNTNGGRAIITALIITNDLLKGSNPAEILEDVANDQVTTNYTDNISGSIKFLNLLSSSLRSNESGREWVSSSEIDEMINDNIWFELYLGLLYEKNKNYLDIRFTASGNTITLESLLKKLNNNIILITDFRNKLSSCGKSLSVITDDLENIANSKKENTQSVILTSYLDLTANFSYFLKQGTTLLSKLNPQLATDIRAFSNIVDPAVSICYDIKSQNYASLVQHVSIILKELNGDNDFLDKFIKYGTFMSSIVQANNSDDIESAIEAAVLPAGSSSIKRETDHNIALNAYIGPFVGMEYLPALKDKKWAFSPGITAPVGLAFSWGNNCVDKSKPDYKDGGSSNSIFISVIDIGSLAAFRLGDDSAHVASDVQLKNIISLGLFYYYGFSNSPLSIGLGVQIGPRLRTINAADFNVDKNFYLRASLSFVVDIPLLNFYTSQ